MNWHHVTANWIAIRDRLARRFPHADPKTLAHPPRDKGWLARHLAEAHDLTIFEAREELEDFLSVEDLARQVMDLRAGR